MIEHEQREGRQIAARHAPGRAADSAAPAQPTREPAPKGVTSRIEKARRQQRGQYETSHSGSRDQTADRIQRPVARDRESRTAAAMRSRTPR